MRSPSRFLGALLLVLGTAGAPHAACAAQDGDAPAREDEGLRAAREVAERAEQAAADALRAEEAARRGRRRALEDLVRAQEDLLTRARDAADAGEVARTEERLRALYRDLGVAASAMAFPPRVPGPAARATAGHVEMRFPPFIARKENAASPAVAAALDWLARHQGTAGNWDSDGYGSQCRGVACLGGGGPLFDVGLTGLATLPFLGAGETHKTPTHGAPVRNALKYLKAVQDAEGCFGPRTSNHFVYNHAIATLAMAEGYGLTQSPLFKGSAQSGIDFILQAQNPYLAWRYGVKPQDNDTSVTGWMVLALRAGVGAGLTVDDGAFRGAVAWLDKVTEPEYGRVGYTARGNGPARPQERMDRFPVDRSESLTAVGILARVLCGAPKDDESLRKGVALCRRCLPAWDESSGSIDMYYWYFGTMAMLQVRGDDRTAWNGSLQGALLPHQRGPADGCANGSWDPVDPWGAEGGRIYSTAIATMALEASLAY